MISPNSESDILKEFFKLFRKVDENSSQKNDDEDLLQPDVRPIDSREGINEE